VDSTLDKLGLARKIQLRVQHYMVAPLIVLRTDMALTVPLRVARSYAAAIMPLPFALPPLEWHVYWHRSADLDPANRWLRETLTDCLAEVMVSNVDQH
jgi:DNA-binding transcriptional LysR family regulator